MCEPHLGSRLGAGFQCSDPGVETPLLLCTLPAATSLSLFVNVCSCLETRVKEFKSNHCSMFSASTIIGVDKMEFSSQGS